jgi:uncharacterized membrane protein YfcA
VYLSGNRCCLRSTLERSAVVRAEAKGRVPEHTWDERKPDMYVFEAIAIGFVAAVLSGMFGVGGAVITTPAIRVLLGVPPGISLGTTLPVAIPTAASGAVTYYRQGLVVKRVALYCCLGGLTGAVGGALLTWFINLHYLMLVTGVVVLYLSMVTVRRGISGSGFPTEPAKTDARELEEPGREETSTGSETTFSIPVMLIIGFAAGFFSGLLGVGGGLILVPCFLYILHIPLKKAFGTSLAVIAVIAVPGTVVHAFLHHISWTLFLYLVVGAIPGAYLGARLSIRTAERVLYVLFGLLLGFFGVVFIVNEIISMTG